MSFNLKGRSYLKLDDFSQREMLYLLDLSRDLKRAKYAGTEQPHAEGQGDLPDLREDLDPHPLRLRGRRPRPGGACHLPRSLGQPDRPQGVDEGHRARARADVRRHRVPRLRPDQCRGAGEVRRRAGLQRPDRRLAPDADARRHADHGREFRQAAHPDRLRLPRRRAQQHGQLAPGARRDDGLRRAHGGAEGEPAARRRAGDRQKVGRADRRAADGDRRHRQGREGRRLRPHRRLGVDGRGRRRSGPSGSSCSRPTRSTWR